MIIDFEEEVFNISVTVESNILLLRFNVTLGAFFIVINCMNLAATITKTLAFFIKIIFDVVELIY